MAIVDIITKPKDCFLCINLPFSKEGFINDLKDESEKDFVKSIQRKHPYWDADALWDNDYVKFINFFDSFEKQVKALGATIKRNFCLRDLNSIKQFDCFTPVAHWVKAKEKVELYDGLFTASEFVEHIPPDYSGIIDLTICYSDQLYDELKQKIRNCAIIANYETTDLEIRLIIYKHTLKKLAFSNSFYIDAQTKIYIDLLKNRKLLKHI
ncbi:MAG: hypothetical protein NT007_16105 [Candidatus Kapabacteria bacterium]|nr:hypothetical protein [Candidatus Kapabacteria bacterium]